MSTHLSSTAIFDSDVLIGASTITPDVKLHVIESGTKVTPYTDTVLALQNSSITTTSCVLNMISGNAGNCDLWFGDTDSATVGYIQWGNSNNVLTVGRSGGVATFNSDGVTVTGTTASQVVQTDGNNRLTSSNTLPFVKVIGGTGTATPRIGGMLHQDTSSYENTTTGEDDLASYTLPAATLSRNGDSLHIFGNGAFGNVSENKTLSIYFGGTLLKILINATNPINHYWVLDSWITRVDATTARMSGMFFHASVNGGTPTCTITTNSSATISSLASAQILKFTGEATSTSAITQQELRVLYYPSHDA